MPKWRKGDTVIAGAVAGCRSSGTEVITCWLKGEFFEKRNEDTVVPLGRWQPGPGPEVPKWRVTHFCSLRLSEGYGRRAEIFGPGQGAAAETKSILAESAETQDHVSAHGANNGGGT